MRSTHCLAFAVGVALLASLSQAAVNPLCPTSPIGACITVTASFSNAVPQNNNFQYLCYSGFPCPSPNDGPKCPCPFTKDNSNNGDTYTPENSLTSTPPGFPQQIRWGKAFTSGIATNLQRQSGFGARGATNVAVPTPGTLFYFARVAHFNYVIFGGGQVRKWHMQLLITLNISGFPVQSTTFDAQLEMDETLNECTSTSTSNGCGDAPYWTQNPTSLEWPGCQNCGWDSQNGFYTRRVGSCSGSTKCCPYRTTPGVPCSDKVWTLSQFNSESPTLNIGGVLYTVYLNGFSVPDTLPLQTKEFFVSQEQQRTEAEMWGRLVRACPPSTSCPPGSSFVLNAAGDACVCQCPVVSCPAGTTLNATCQCECTQNCGPCGSPITVNGACAGCQCNSNPLCCGTGSRQVAAGASCTCACPANVCTAPKVLSNASDITCPCACPPSSACTAPKVQNQNDCTCACPANSCDPTRQDVQADCSCKCKPTVCTAPFVLSVPDGSDPNCACKCPACATPGMVADPTRNCACSCPTGVCQGQQVPDPTDSCLCKCPACPGNQVLVNPTGTDCACACPSSSCVAPQTLISGNTACACQCPACVPPQVRPDGWTITPGGGCPCQCPANFCPAGKRLVAGANPTCQCECAVDCAATVGVGSVIADSYACTCTCPTDFCTNGGTLVAGAIHPNCACNCPTACVGEQVRGANCACTCPHAIGVNGATQASLDQMCKTKFNDVDYLFDAATCTCGCPPATPSCQCKCPPTNNTCYTIAAGQFCTGGDVNTCPITYNNGALCGSCSRCSGKSCLPFNINTECAGVLPTDPADRTCFSPACDDAHGGCFALFREGNSCPGPSVPPSAASCWTSVCANDRCEVEFHADYPCTVDFLSEGFSSADLPCLATECREVEGCKVVLAPGATCVASPPVGVTGADTQCYASQCVLDSTTGQPGCRSVALDSLSCFITGVSDNECSSTVCRAGRCVAVYENTSVACASPSGMPTDPSDQQCYLPRCDGAGACTAQFSTELECSADTSGVAAEDLQCYASECVNDGCEVVFTADAPCVLSGTEAAQQCMTPLCTGSSCQLVFDPALPPNTPCALDLVAAFGAADAECFVAECVPPAGCQAVAQIGAACELAADALDNLAAGDRPCWRGQCSATGCVPVFSNESVCADPADAPAGDTQCYTAVCDAVVRACAWRPTAGASCSDGDPCTVDRNTVDPVTNSLTDACVAASATSSDVLVCVGADDACALRYEADVLRQYNACIAVSNANQCDKEVEKLRAGNCTYVCHSDSSGMVCLDPCALAASKSASSDKAAIIAGTLVGGAALLLILAALIFAYVKWGHEQVMKLFRTGDTKNTFTMDNRLYDGMEANHTGALYDGR